MQSLVIRLSRYAREKIPGFIIIPQNGHELLLSGGTSPLLSPYIDAIDAVGQEELFYGYDGLNKATAPQDHAFLLEQVTIAREAGKSVLVIDYCNKQPLVDDAYAKNTASGFVSFVAPDRELSTIPTYPSAPHQVHAGSVTTIREVRNFLYLINPGDYEDPVTFLQDLQATEYDLVLIDLFFEDDPFTAREIELLKWKKSGARRLVIAYMSIGEAEDYRYYWQKGWRREPPVWLDRENPYWKGNYKVRYWEEQWQQLLITSPDSYLNRILAAGFDGVYLDIIDAFVYFEDIIEKLPAAKK